MVQNVVVYLIRDQRSCGLGKDFLHQSCNGSLTVCIRINQMKRLVINNFLQQFFLVLDWPCYPEYAFFQAKLSALFHSLDENCKNLWDIFFLVDMLHYFKKLRNLWAIFSGNQKASVFWSQALLILPYLEFVIEL